MELKNIMKEIEPRVVLDEVQCQILMDDENKMAIIAAAGSGKTMTLIAKTIYLLKNKSIKQSEILILAFTNKAVEELKSRLIKFNYGCVKVLTFHKLAIEIIETCGKDFNETTDGRLEFQKAVENLLIENYYFKKILNRIRKNESMEKTISRLYTLFKYSKTHGILYKDIENQEFREILTIVNQEYIKIMNENNKCDFDDLIITASILLKREAPSFSYQYIMIDEFQDISKIRYILVQMLLEVTFAKLIIVGDDYQSIYGFSGSDIDIFYEVVSASKTYYLINTYRNSQQLINIAGSFINKGNFHLNKKLISQKQLDRPIFFYYYLQFRKKECLLKILNNIIKINDCEQEVFLLGRYRKDCEFLETIKSLNKIDENKYSYKNLKLYFLTIHSAKGLSADNVVILNFNKGKYGFPSNKRDDYLVKILPNYRKINYYEERRLFYVALTRTKNHVFLMVPIFGSSKFIKEIKRTPNY